MGTPVKIYKSRERHPTVCPLCGGKILRMNYKATYKGKTQIHWTEACVENLCGWGDKGTLVEIEGQLEKFPV